MKYFYVHKHIPPAPSVPGFWPGATVSSHGENLLMNHQHPQLYPNSRYVHVNLATNSHFHFSLRQLVFLTSQPAGGTALTFMARTPTKLFFFLLTAACLVLSGEQRGSYPQAMRPAAEFLRSGCTLNVNAEIPAKLIRGTSGLDVIKREEKRKCRDPSC